MAAAIVLLLACSAVPAKAGDAESKGTHPDQNEGSLPDKPPGPSPIPVRRSVLLPEIVVTAQKRAEDIQDVPVSITALSSTFIEDSGLSNIFDASQYLPNVQINPVLDARSTAIRIRGIGSDGLNAGIEPSVGVFIDGIYQGRTGAASIVDFADTERIEVLRGPQGTLYGKNTAAGAINVVTMLPTLNKWEGLIEGVAGNYAAKEVRGTINAPLVRDRVALRLSGYWMVRDPFDENLAGGDGRNNGDRNGVRLKALVDVTDDIELVLWGDYGTEQTSCCVADIITYDGYPNLDVTFAKLAAVTGRPLPAANPFDRVVDANEPSTSDVRVWGVAGELKYSINNHLLTWLNGYRRFGSFSVIDADFSSYDAVFQETDESFRQFSSELRLTSPSGRDFEYVTGLYLYYQKDNTRGELGIGPDWFLASSVGPLLQGSADERGRVFNTDTNTHETQSYAFYGQGTYHLTPRWALTAGLRGTFEKKSRVGSQIAGFKAIDAGPFGPDRFADESLSVFNLSPMATIQFYPTPEVNVFAKVARGFKSGGFNQLRTTKDVDTEFADENATDVELGARSTWLDRRVTLNTTAFYTWYDDLQSNVFDGSAFSVTSADRVSSYGVETEGLFALHPAIVVGVAAGYNVAEYDSFPDARCTAEQAYFKRIDGGTLPIPTRCTQDLSGRPLDNAPQWSISTFAQLTHGLGTLPGVGWSILGFARAEYSYRDVIYLQQDLDVGLKDPPVNLVNLRAGVRTKDEAWELTLWTRNLTNAGYNVVGFDVPILSGFAAVNGPPRTFGATLRYRF